jgi:sarcosine oxidase
LSVQQVETVVIGGGAVGSAVAYHLTRRGRPVTLVEQFQLGHDRGSSHGTARITRHAYANPAYATMMCEAYTAWAALEADLGRPLFVRTGGVSISPPGSSYAGEVAQALQRLDVPHRAMNGHSASRLFPALSIPDDHTVVFEPDAGMLLAERAVLGQLTSAAARGAQVLEQQRVLKLDLDGARPRIVCEGLSIEARRVVVAAGGWVGRLVPGLAGKLVPTRQHVYYYEPDSRGYEIGCFPIFIYMGSSDLDAFYGMPSILGSGLKVAHHGGPDTDPEVEERLPPDQLDDAVARFLARYLPGLASLPPARRETCIYTVAPDDEFAVGFLPGRRDVVIASACSGHGFKFSHIVGRRVADLVEGRDSEPDDPWSRTLAGLVGRQPV